MTTSTLSENDYNIPEHFNQLDPKDKEEYIKLREKFYNIEKTTKGKDKLQSLTNAINDIKTFCRPGSSDDWKRSIACGIIFLSSSSIAINIQQLKILLCRCKSSINGSFKSLGYSSLSYDGKKIQKLLSKIPEFKNTKRESKKWTIKKHESDILDEDEYTLNIGTDVRMSFNPTPCPIKFKDRFYEATHKDSSIQTEFSFPYDFSPMQNDDFPNYD